MLCCRFEKLTTVTNLLLLNLVLSCLLFIVSMPFAAAELLLSHWPFGDVICKLVGSLYYLGFYSSVLFLTLLTFDRHLAVVYSLSAQRVRSRTYVLVSCAVVWILSALASIKPMILHKSFTNQLDDRAFCQDDPQGSSQLLWSVGFYTQLLFFFLLPLLVIIYCYTRIVCTVLSSQIVSKFKTVRLIFVLVLLFFICWTPYNIALLMYESANTPEEHRRWQVTLNVTQKFTHLYFCISPIFYTFVGRKYQNYFRMLLVRHFPGLKRHISISQISPTYMSS
uniref:G-protein coupled receptors family 1 profile domain-containing protein n=1 Tax=Neogobius melanostomus TaxID=47308 RepID=A0A8C6U4K8_9GOBI